MNRKMKLSCAVLLLLSSFVGCKVEEKSVITLKTYIEEFQIHTDLQQYYLDVMFNEGYSPDETIDEVKGTEELSRPNPVELEWNDSISSTSYTIEVSKSNEFVNKQVFTSSNNKIEIYNLEIGTTYYWRVIDEEEASEIGTFKIAGDGPRNIYMDGVTNVRDIGGWVNKDGKRTNQGFIYRGARLNNSYKDGYEDERIEPDYVVPEITDEGIDVFINQLGIKTEIDLRLDSRNGFPEGITPYSVVDESINYIALPMNGNASSIGENAIRVKELIEILAKKENYPVFIHCNIGTDRTGMVSYIINALLGLDDESLLKDYLFSNMGKINTLKSPVNSHNEFFGLNDYEGETLQQRAEAYLKSIGVSEEIYNAVREIMLED